MPIKDEWEYEQVRLLWRLSSISYTMYNELPWWPSCYFFAMCVFWEQKCFRLLRFVVLPNGSSQINPLRTRVQSTSFQRHPNPFQAESQLIAFKNEPHLPSPLGSPGPQNLFVSEIFVPSDQTQFNRPLNPRNNSRSSKVISFLWLTSCFNILASLATARSASCLWQNDRAELHVLEDKK